MIGIVAQTEFSICGGLTFRPVVPGWSHRGTRWRGLDDRIRTRPENLEIPVRCFASTGMKTRK